MRVYGREYTIDTTKNDGTETHIAVLLSVDGKRYGVQSPPLPTYAAAMDWAKQAIAAEETGD